MGFVGFRLYEKVNAFYEFSLRQSSLKRNTPLKKKSVRFDGKDEEGVKETPPTPLSAQEDEEKRLGLKSTLAKNVFQLLFKTQPRRINELFLPRRMAYVVDLTDAAGQDEENERSSNPLDDIPTTLIRSKADCPNADVKKKPEKNFLLNLSFSLFSLFAQKRRSSIRATTTLSSTN